MFLNSYSFRTINRLLYLGIFSIITMPSLVFAQVRGDQSLGTENSIVTPNIEINGILSDRVDGGATRGSNLFHSFSDLNVAEGRGLYFSNPAGITNIINRVTGNNPSSILGKLGVLGNANLFLVNPNGIIFGPHASLDLGGSFVATTANAIQFGEQGLFSASNPEVPPLLTVNPSAFIFNRLRANPIRLISSKEPAGVRFNDIYQETDIFGLRVPDGKSLILLGGDVILNNSEINALDGGHVALGGIAEKGTVGLSINEGSFNLNFPSHLALADVSLAQGSRVYTTGDRGGSIQVTGHSVRIIDGSSLAAETFGEQAGRNITITAKDTLEVVGNPPYGIIKNPSISTITYGNGNGGDIMINTQKLLVRDGAQISIISAGGGNGGQLVVQALDSVEIKGVGTDGIYSALTGGAVLAGKGGNISITTQNLIIKDRGVITVESLGFANSNDISDAVATGDGGNITINASNSVLVSGTGTNITSNTSGVGNAGNITINTGILTIQNGGVITVASYEDGSGKAGNLIINAAQAVNLMGTDSTLSATADGLRPAGSLTIKTGNLNVSDGAQVTVSNPLSQAGNLNIDTDTLMVTGNKSSIIASTNNGQAGNISIRARNSVTLNDQGEISVQADGIGKAGNLTIETREISVSDQAKATVSSTKGQAGNLTIIANNLLLDRGFLTAETAETGVNGANINLQLSNLLKMQNESLISAQATGGANGGNITINSPLLAVLLPTGPNGSDIIAKAEKGTGGNIFINSQGIFGTAEGKAIPNNKSNDIDASSEYGAPGRVLINNTIDPNQGTITLPEDVVDPNTLVAQNACKRGTASQLTRAGQGGLAPTVYEDLTSPATQVSLVEPTTTRNSNSTQSSIPKSQSSVQTINPAQGWVFNQQGKVMLVAYDPTAIGSQRIKGTEPGCPIP